MDAIKYKLVIFDFDGTLADSFPLFLKLLNQLADQHNFRKADASELDLLRSYNVRQIIKHIGLPYWKMPIIGNQVKTLMGQNLDQIALFPGVSELLPRLVEKGITLAIVSSNSLENIRQVLGPANTALITYFECGTSLFGKRHRIGKVLKRSGFKPAEALCVGDEIRDIEAARDANVAFGGVAWGYAKADTLRALTPEVFNTVEEIAAFVQP